MCWCRCARQHGWETTKDFSAAWCGIWRRPGRSCSWQERSAQPGGQDLRGLPAQRLWRDRGALVGAGAAGACRSRCRSAGTNWSRCAAARWTIADARERWISAIVLGWVCAANTRQGHGGAWFASVVKARGCRQAGGPRQGRQRLLHRRRRMPHVVFLFIERNGVGPCIQEHRAFISRARVRFGVGHQRMSRARCLARPRPPQIVPRAGAGHGQGTQVACP